MAKCDGCDGELVHHGRQLPRRGEHPLASQQPITEPQYVVTREDDPREFRFHDLTCLGWWVQERRGSL